MSQRLVGRVEMGYAAAPGAGRHDGTGLLGAAASTIGGQDGVGMGMTERGKGLGETARPWTIKGISMETRQAVIMAARRERKSIGDWVERALRDQALGVLKGPAAATAAAHGTLGALATPLGSLESLLESLATQVAELTRAQERQEQRLKKIRRRQRQGDAALLSLEGSSQQPGAGERRKGKKGGAKKKKTATKVKKSHSRLKETFRDGALDEDWLVGCFRGEGGA
ncbi:MAG: hypothetical protein H7831_08915 [Magnetococcus sp. WYHC-3]